MAFRTRHPRRPSFLSPPRVHHVHFPHLAHFASNSCNSPSRNFRRWKKTQVKIQAQIKHTSRDSHPGAAASKDNNLPLTHSETSACVLARIILRCGNITLWHKMVHTSDKSGPCADHPDHHHRSSESSVQFSTGGLQDLIELYAFPK